MIVAAHGGEAIMLIIASLLALLVGITLGITGGGGSILTVPILRYVLGMDAHRAIAMSMVVVGTTSLTALIPHARQGHVRFRMGLSFGVAGMIGAFVAGRFTRFIPSAVLLTGFALLMLGTAFFMLCRPTSAPSPRAQPARNVTLAGLAVGAMTGLLGAGGGFVIVPVLMLSAELTIDAAVGTSLLVIALNSWAGLAGIAGHVSFDWQLVSMITAAAAAGSLVGGRLARRISPTELRAGFGWFVAAMACVILVHELPGFWIDPSTEDRSARNMLHFER